ncbi:tryptophan-rich sensory protein [Patescibacteria group bacterium]|nr:tryptophan-rich sensory protein [Patescibacteria group bacterium]MBU4453193.1 tryptophan-rich sensory protein [Patescibacteria group bacterium]MCG2687232.1 tryptophan-rich sensory protein [Candidatus Parcubacteria bacterium]
MKAKQIFQLIGSIILCQLAGLLGSLFTIGAIDGWYQALNKPFFNPPSWLFGPVWTMLYTLMGVAFYLLWTRTPQLFKRNESKNLVFLFLIHLVFNAIWSPIFFGLHQIAFALVIIIVMVISLTYIMYKAWNIDRRVTYILIPYLAWILFASILNLALLILN